MKIYADRPLRATNQLLGDLLVVLWVFLWVWLATKVHDKVGDLAGPGREAESAGNNLARSLRNAGNRVADIPLAGDRLRAPFDDGAGAGREFAAAAQSYQDTVADLARVTALAVALIPILILLVVWLPRRIRWIIATSAAKRLLRASADDDRALDLFALRALVHQPLTRLTNIADDPVEAWRTQDRVAVQNLAELELAQLGLYPRR
jgi:hypothetical protein